MKNFYKNFKKSVLTLALLLMTTANIWAQTSHPTSVTYTSTQTVSTNYVLVGNTTITVNSGCTVTYTGVISGSSSYTLTKSGAGTLVFANNNTYTGNTSISNGTLQIGNFGTTGAVAGNISVSSGAYLDFARTNDYEYSKIISGSGGIYVFQSGTNTGKVILTGANTFTGYINVQLGATLQIGNGSSGSIDYSTSNGIQLNSSSSTLIFNLGSSMTTNCNRNITGYGKLVKQGIGTLRLTSPSTYSTNLQNCSISVEGGSLYIGNFDNTGAINNANIQVNSGCSFWFACNVPTFSDSKLRQKNLNLQYEKQKKIYSRL